MIKLSRENYSCINSLEIRERLPVLAKSKTLASVPIDTTDFSMSGINSSKNFYHDNRYTLVDYYDHYDGRLNLTCFHKDQGSAESMIYGYNFSLPWLW